MTKPQTELQGILDIVYDGIDLLNQQRRGDEQLIKSPDLVLIGDDSDLDSFALATLVLAVERGLKDKLGVEVDLFGEDLDENMAKLRTPTALAQSIGHQVS